MAEEKNKRKRKIADLFSIHDGLTSIGEVK